MLSSDCFDWVLRYQQWKILKSSSKWRILFEITSIAHYKWHKLGTACLLPLVIKWTSFNIMYCHVYLETGQSREKGKEGQDRKGINTRRADFIRTEQRSWDYRSNGHLCKTQWRSWRKSLPVIFHNKVTGTKKKYQASSWGGQEMAKMLCRCINIDCAPENRRRSKRPNLPLGLGGKGHRSSRRKAGRPGAAARVKDSDHTRL